MPVATFRPSSLFPAELGRDGGTRKNVRHELVSGKVQPVPCLFDAKRVRHCGGHDCPSIYAVPSLRPSGRRERRPCVSKLRWSSAAGLCQSFKERYAFPSFVGSGLLTVFLLFLLHYTSFMFLSCVGRDRGCVRVDRCTCRCGRGGWPDVQMAGNGHGVSRRGGRCSCR